MIPVHKPNNIILKVGTNEFSSATSLENIEENMLNITMVWTEFTVTPRKGLFKSYLRKLYEICQAQENMN